MHSRSPITNLSFVIFIMLVYSCLYYTAISKTNQKKSIQSTTARQMTEQYSQINTRQDISTRVTRTKLEDKQVEKNVYNKYQKIVYPQQPQAIENKENTRVSVATRRKKQIGKTEAIESVATMQPKKQIPGREANQSEATTIWMKQIPGREANESEATSRWMKQIPGREANESEATSRWMKQIPGREANDSEATTIWMKQIPGREANESEATTRWMKQIPGREAIDLLYLNITNPQNDTEIMSHSDSTTSNGNSYTKNIHSIDSTSIRPDIRLALNIVHMNKTKITAQPLLKLNYTSIYKGTEYRNPKLVHVAMGLGITTKAAKGAANLETFNITSLIFFKTLMHSFCDTASPDYNYHFYVAHDHNDIFFSQNSSHKLFRESFNTFIEIHCKLQNVSVVTLTLIDCPHNGNPAWAQNDAILAAHKDENDFFYRVNDDAHMTSKDWTRQYIEALAKFNPPFVGVVGPKHIGGNLKIMTFDFTHRTHVDIFGYHYPRIFKSWFADTWITDVYKPNRSKKILSVTLHHTKEKGVRYKVDRSLAKKKKITLKGGKDIIERYLKMYEATVSKA